MVGTVYPQEDLPWGIERNLVGRTEVQPPVILNDGAESEPSQVAVSKVEEDLQKKEVQPEAALNPKENLPLLEAACSVLEAIQERDYTALAGYVHPERGLTITPYSTVSAEDMNFSGVQVKKFAADTTQYIWGVVPGSGELIQMTPEKFISSYIFNVDYTQASKIAIDKINISGNALENVTEAYPDCRFVEFTFPGLDASYEGLDWCSLKVVMAPSDSKWLLVGLIHSQWTV